MTTNAQSPIDSPFNASSTSTEVLDGVDLSGTTALVTGGYSGLGLETTSALVSAGARVIVPARRPDVARERLEGIDNVTVISADLADLATIRSAAEELRSSESKLDLLITAAGVMATPERRVGPGWESQFGINHLGHFALVNELLPLLENADGARVVSYSSAGHHASDIRWDDLEFTAGHNKWLAYGQSKTANALFALHLNSIGQDRGIRAYSVHPGNIFTDLQRDLPQEEIVALGWMDEEGNITVPDLKSTAQGAATGLWAATAPVLDAHGGIYAEDVNIARVVGPDSEMQNGGVREYAIDPEGAERLWKVSAELTDINA